MAQTAEFPEIDPSQAEGEDFAVMPDMQMFLCDIDGINGFDGEYPESPERLFDNDGSRLYGYEFPIYQEIASENTSQQKDASTTKDADVAKYQDDIADVPLMVAPQDEQVDGDEPCADDDIGDDTAAARFAFFAQVDGVVQFVERSHPSRILFEQR